MPTESNRTRETLYAALFSLLKVNLTANANVPVTSFGRRDMDPKKVPSSAQPAVIMVQGEERSKRTARGLVRWHLGVLVCYYFIGQAIGGYFDQEPTTLPVTIVNNLIDGIEAAILTKDMNGNPIAQGVQTLGGLVNDVFIEGSVLYNQIGFDTPGNQGIITIPVWMETGQ